MPPALLLIIAIPLATPVWILFGFKNTSGILAGIITGYMYYDLFHYISHHPPKFLKNNSYLNFMRRYHILHHYKFNNLGFGVSSVIWDVFFNTLIPIKENKNR